MNRTTFKLLAAALLLAGVQQAFAQTPIHTEAGVKVGNTAKVDYKVDDIAQTQESGTADFVVDRLVNLKVTTTDTAEVAVVPDSNHTADTSTSKALRFAIQNLTNSAIGVTLAAANAATSTVNPFDAGNDDIFNVGEGSGSFRIYLDADDDNVFEPGADDGASIASIASIARESTVHVWVVADIPAVGGTAPNVHPVNDDVALVSLQATAVEPTTLTAITYKASTDANVDNVEGQFDSIKGDQTPGVVGGETAYDGVDSAYSAYIIASAHIGVTKKSFVLWDPVNLTTNPKAIPGAKVLYCIEVSNDGSVAAADVTITDDIPGGTTYIADTVHVNEEYDTAMTCNTAAATAGTALDDVDDSAYSSGTVTTTVTSLAADKKTSTVFQVTIN